jgi:four helix bundle protein
MRNYRDLQVWSKAHALILDLYHVSKDFPREEIYGLTNQLRRAASSIGLNLAEGCGRQRSSELAYFVRIAMGSASELDYQLLLCHDLGYLGNDDFRRTTSKLTEVRKMLTSFLSKVEQQANSETSAGAAGAN